MSQTKVKKVEEMGRKNNIAKVKGVIKGERLAKIGMVNLPKFVAGPRIRFEKNTKEIWPKILKINVKVGFR